MCAAELKGASATSHASGLWARLQARAAVVEQSAHVLQGACADVDGQPARPALPRKLSHAPPLVQRQRPKLAGRAAPSREVCQARCVAGCPLTRTAGAACNLSSGRRSPVDNYVTDAARVQVLRILAYGQQLIFTACARAFCCPFAPTCREPRSAASSMPPSCLIGVTTATTAPPTADAFA